MNARQIRLLRAGLVAGFSVVVAAFSHVAAGGPPPGSLGIALALVFAWLGCIPLVGRRLPLWRLSTAVLTSQLLLHAFFLLRVTGDAGLPADAAGHAHGATGLAVASGAAAHTAHEAPLMWVAHVIAAGLTIAAIRRGELALRSLASLAARVVRVLVLVIPRPHLLPQLRLVAAPLDVTRPIERMLATAHLTRGPPARALA